MFRSQRRAQVLLIAAGTLAICVTACGGAEDGAGAAPSAGPVKAVDTAAMLKKAYAGVIGSVTTTPTTVPAGKSVWIVSCGQAVSGCSTPAAGMAAASKAIGWSSKICDGKLNPAGWATCIRQGISARPDVITVVGQDCSSFVAPLKEAAAAGITTVGVGGDNCPSDGFTGVVQKLADHSPEKWYETIGALQADWLIAKTGGKASVLSLQFQNTTLGTSVQKGFVNELATCPGCRIVRTLPIDNQDLGGGTMAPKFATALSQNPAINAVNVPIDGWLLAGLAQAVQASGRSDEISVIGAFGPPANLDLIRKGGGEDATVALSETWDGWSGIDAAIRVLNQQPIEPQGIGLQVVDQDTNMPGKGQSFAYNPQIDFIADFKKTWGL